MLSQLAAAFFSSRQARSDVGGTIVFRLIWIDGDWVIGLLLCVDVTGYRVRMIILFTVGIWICGWSKKTPQLHFSSKWLRLLDVTPKSQKLKRAPNDWSYSSKNRLFCRENPQARAFFQRIHQFGRITRPRVEVSERKRKKTVLNLFFREAARNTMLRAHHNLGICVCSFIMSLFDFMTIILRGSWEQPPATRSVSRHNLPLVRLAFRPSSPVSICRSTK